MVKNLQYWRGCLVGFIIMFCFFGLQCSFSQDLVPALLDQGLKLYAAKDYVGAVDYLGQVVDMAPDQHQARFYLIYSLAMSGNRDRALEQARILAGKQPGEAQYGALVTQLQAEIAKEQAKKEAVKNKGAAGPVPKEVMLGGYKTRDVIREPRVSTQTYEIAPARPKTSIDLAIEKIDEEDYEAARKMLGEILAKDSKDARAHHYLGVISFNAGEYQEAIKEFDKAILADAKNFQSFFLLGDCYRALDDLKKAEEQFRKALLIKEDIFAMLNIAEVLTRQGRLKEAEELYEKITSKDPGISDAKIGLAQIKLFKGFVEDASVMINTVISGGSGNPEAYYTKAQILLENKLFEDAGEEAKKAMQSVPGNLKYRSIYALSQVRGFNVPKGLEEAASILKEYPENVDARLVIAEGLIMSGASGDAEEHLEEVEKRVKHPQVSRLRATSAIRAGETDKAKGYFREYMDRAAGQAKPSLEFAQFLETNQQESDALQAYYEIVEQFGETAYAAEAKDGIARLEAKKNSAAEIERQEKSGLRPGKVKY